MNDLSLTSSQVELVKKMDSMTGCYLRAHMMPRGRKVRGFRLLDKNKNPLMSVQYSIVLALVERMYLQPVCQGGVVYHYYRTDKKLNRYE